MQDKGGFEGRRSGKTRASCLLVVCLILAASGTGGTQNSKPPLATQPGQSPGFGPEMSPGLREKQAKLQNEERQKRLEDDTQKLLTLATQLHDDVTKTDKNILSLDVVKRADEIERLAHAVKDRMRG